ncbi:hypothetical protein [Fulvimonas yonginensis]|uniref:Uncharacterized protein n=1 Tax=Fulvimonas yonginensis TaxID=1495200 RepID=A0ABU8JAP7_9GAMM
MAWRNRIRGITASTAFGIFAQNTGIRVDDNQVFIDPATGFGIAGRGNADTICIGNTVIGFSDPLNGCQDAGGNIVH